MDFSQVIDVASLPEGSEQSPRWLFEPDDSTAPDLYFDTEAEACAAQQGYRIARGFHPITGEKVA